MKMPLPKMKPKQKFVLFAVISLVVISVVLMYRAFSEEDKAASRGTVKVSQGASSNATPVTGSKATNDTEAQRKLREIEEAERKKRLSGKSGESYIDKPDLTPKIEKVVDEESIKDDKSNVVLSIDDLVNEIAKDKEEPKEKPKENIVDKFTEKKRIQDEAVSINFDRRSYMSSLENIAKNNQYDYSRFAPSAPVAATIVERGPLTLNKSGDIPPNTGIRRTTGNNDSLVTDTLSKRDRLLNDFLEDTGLKKNDDNSVAQNENTIMPTASEGSEYPYKEVKTVGETAYAINRLPINTDGMPIVQLTLVSPGDMNNAVLSGDFTKMQDSVVLKFTTYSKNGKSYPINAIAIDPETWESMLADDVDKHYWERYGGVILASVIQGYAQSLQNVSISDTDAGQRETREKLGNFNDRLMVGFGKAGATLAPHFLANANRESTVYLYKDRPVAVLFLENFKVPISD